MTAYPTCDVLALGTITVDDMLYVERYPRENTKSRIIRRHRQGGGRAACAMAAAAALGTRAAVLGWLGDDDWSHYVHRHLATAGVDLTRLCWGRQHSPLHCVIIVSEATGSRTIHADYTTVHPVEPEELNPDWFAGARVFLVDNMHPPTVRPALAMARAAGCQTVSDIERDLPNLDDVLPLVDHWICGKEFAHTLTGCDAPPQACARLAEPGHHRSVVVTAGGDGCYWWSATTGRVQHEPGHSVEVVDTTGCGDVFHGVFCHGLAAGLDLAETVELANAAAAIKATRHGGWASVPTPREIAARCNARPKREG